MPAMGERFTNKHLKFYQQIKSELISPVQTDKNEQTKAVFLQFSELPVDRFAIHFIKGQTCKLVLRRWNNQFDNDRFLLGIYNLDRITINESIIGLSNRQVQQLEKLIAADQSVKSFDGIMLDGYYFSLSLWSGNVERHLEWKLESQLSEVTKDLINVLMQIAGI